MEPARFCTWASSNNSSGSNNFVHQEASSWEEEAFAEDAFGPFGAFIWPPRSYSCSFCGREFKSAQALGGHMNVHRRDRARLKQFSPIPQVDLRYQKPSDSRTSKYPNDHTSTMDSNSGDVNNNTWELLAPISTIAVSASPTNPGIRISTHDNDHQKRPFYSSHPSLSDTDSFRSLSILDSNIEEDYCIKERNSRPHEGDNIARENNLPVRLNLAIASGNNDEMVSNCKRRRRDGDEVSLPLFLIKATSEELDLELRLGDQPKA